MLKYSDDIQHTFSTGEGEQEIERQVRQFSEKIFLTKNTQYGLAWDKHSTVNKLT